MRWIVLGERRVKEIVERLDRLLVPAEFVGRDRRCVSERGIEIEAAIDVDREVLAGADNCDLVGHLIPSSAIRQRLHHGPEILLRLEADP